MARASSRRQWAAVALATAVVAAAASAGAQRDASSDTRPAFEVATVKPARPDVARTVVMPPPASPTRLIVPGMTLATLIYAAYGDGGFNTAMRVTGGPDWMGQATFAVEGLASEPSTLSQFRLMLQRLLEERFALRLRVEMTIADMLTLVVARSDGTLGPKVKPWSGTCLSVMPALYLQAPRRPLKSGMSLSPADRNVAECPSGYRADGIWLDGVTMSTVAEVLSLPPGRALLGTIVTDQTGLEGRYTLELDYPFPPQRAFDPAAPADFAPPSLFTAVEEQWGLRIVRGKGPFRLVVVESAQLPAAN